MVRSEGNMSLKNPVTPPGIDPGTVRLVAQRLNQYATTGPSKHMKQINLLRNCPEKSRVCHQAVCTVKRHYCTELCSLKLAVRCYAIC